MTTEEKRSIKISFPFNLYLKQLFTADNYVRFINPFSFWRRYRIDHLETCQSLNIVQHLERCHQMEWRSAQVFDHQMTKRCTKSSTFVCFPFEQSTPNTIVVFQPSIELKYCGVTYHTKNIWEMNINSFEIDPQQDRVQSIEQSSNFCRINTPEIFSTN